MRAGLYARVSTSDQSPENQLDTLRAFVSARRWTTIEFVDRGVSGAVQRRLGLDTLLVAARSRRIDVVVVTKLDRLARSTHHLVALSKELAALGVDLVVLDQAIDTTTPSGRLLFHVLAAIAEFERDLIRDRVMAGLRRAKAQGRQLGRPRKHFITPEQARAAFEATGGQRAAARRLGVPVESFRRALALSQTLVAEASATPRPGTTPDAGLGGVIEPSGL